VTGQAARAKVRDWLARYGLAECAGICGALAGAAIVRHLGGNAVAVAYAGAWGETIGYAGVIAWRDVLAGLRLARRHDTSWRTRTMGYLVTDWSTEFGPSGILDTFVTRPACMGLGMRFLGKTRGLVAGKLVADLVFYIPVILIYERRKHVRAHRLRR
jgi:hypothetical protein